MTMRRLATITLAALATLAGVLLLWQFRDAMVLFLLSLAVAAALRPLVDRQVEMGWPRSRSLLLVYVVTLLLLAIVLFIVSGPLLDDLRQVADNFVLRYDALWLAWPQGTPVQRAIASWLPPPEALYSTVTGAAALQGMLGATVSFFDLLSSASFVVMLSVYWSSDQDRFERLWLSVLSAEQRARAREIWRSIESGVGAYIRSEMTQSFLAGLLLGVGYWLLGVPYPVLLGVISALIWLVPWLGAVLALLLVLVVSGSMSLLLAAAAGVLTVAVFLLLEFVVEPRLYNRRQYSALLVVLVLIIMGEAYGLLGILAAPPLAAALQILMTTLMAPATPPAEKPVDEHFVLLQERLTVLRATISAAGADAPPQLLSLVARLEKLLDETRAVLTPGATDRDWVPPKVRTLADAPANK
jgi:putative permease